MRKDHVLTVVFTFPRGDTIETYLDGRINPYKRKTIILEMANKMKDRPTHFQLFKRGVVVSDKIEFIKEGEGLWFTGF